MEAKKLHSKNTLKQAGKIVVSVVALVYIIGITLPQLILPFFKKSFHD